MCRRKSQSTNLPRQLLVLADASAVPPLDQTPPASFQQFIPMLVVNLNSSGWSVSRTIYFLRRNSSRIRNVYVGARVRREVWSKGKRRSGAVLMICVGAQWELGTWRR